jgi:ABC-type nitrate/sulfonate/bicarbonate transport system permease component
MGWIPVAVGIVLWETSVRSGAVRSDNWPLFSDVLRALARGLVSGELLQVVGSTLLRALAGCAVGAAAGVAVAILFESWPWARRAFNPALELLRPLPIPAVIPPLIVLLGIDNPMKVTVVAITAFYPLLINTAQGLHSLDPVLLGLARTFRLGAVARIRRIVVPATLPFVVTGLRISLALSLITAVIAEMIAGDTGVGHYLMLMQYATRASDMYAAVVLLAITGYALNRCVSLVERRALFWQQSATAPE